MLLFILLCGIVVFILLKVYKNDIIHSIQENVRTNNGLDLKVETIQFSFFANWPHATIELKNVEANSILYKGPKEAFFKAGSVYLSFNLRKLMHKQLSIKHISIKNAKVRLHKKRDGSINYTFKTLKKDSSSTDTKLQFDINKITLKNTAFTFLHDEKTQRISFTLIDNTIRLIESDEEIQAKIKGKVHIGGLIFKSKKGAFLKNATVDLDLNLAYFKDQKSLCIYPPSYVLIEKHNYLVTCLLELGEKQRFTILAKSNDVDLFKVSKLLNPKIQKVLSNFHLSQAISADALISVSLRERQEPALIVSTEVKNVNLTIGTSNVPYSNVYFKGRIVSIRSDGKAGDEDNASISLPDIKGNLYNFPFNASVIVKSFTEPLIEIEANMLIEAVKIKNEIAQKFRMNGTCLTKISYSGPTNKLNTQDFLDPEMKLKALLVFKNFSFQPRKNHYTFALEGNAVLNKQDLSFQNLNFRTNGGNAILNGKTENFTNYALGLSNYLKSNLDVSIKHFNLNPFFVDSRALVARSLSSKTNSTNSEMFQNTIKMADDDLELNFKIKAKSLLVKKVQATNATLVIKYKKNVIHVNSIDMDVCEGKLKAKADVYGLKHLRSKFEIDRVNINQLFQQLDNFGQEAITADNIQGNLNLTASFDSELDEQKNIVPESMSGEVKLKLKDGHLLNFEPMQNITNYIFKNRDFKDISFSEINETFKLKGNTMKIEEMELASNVINMYVSGVFQFKGNSVINVLIPWNNLKRRERDHVPSLSGTSAEDAKGLKLNFAGELKKMKLSMGHKVANF